MEIFSRHESEPKCHKHHLLHCIMHATLQVATLAAAILTLNEVEKMGKAVRKFESRRK